MNWNWTLIVSILATIFYLLQWWALEKQNNQNLFKLRIDHYLKLNRLIKIFKELFEKENSKYLLVSRQLKELEDIELNISNLKNESIYLFGDDIFNLETDLSSMIHSCIVAVQAFPGDSCYAEVTDYFKTLEITNENMIESFKKYLKLI